MNARPDLSISGRTNIKNQNMSETIRTDQVIPGLSQLQKDEETLALLDKFIFFFHIDNPASRCCCGCSLKTGIIWLSIFLIADSITGVNTLPFSFSLYSYIAYSLLYLIFFFYSLFFLFTLYNKSSFLAYVAYIMQIICIPAQIIHYAVISFQNTESSTKLTNSLVVPLIVEAIFGFIIHFYYTWIGFSYCRFLATGDWGTIEGYEGKLFPTPIQGIEIGESVNLPRNNLSPKRGNESYMMEPSKLKP